MAREANQNLSGDGQQRPSGSGDVTVQDLSWALIDGQIDSGELQLFESMLIADETARAEYLDCVQLHTDLMAHFAQPPGAEAAAKLPVLGFLGSEYPTVDSPATQP